MAALGIIGFLALLTGIIMLIVSAIRKRRLWIWGIIAAAGFVLLITGVALSEPSTTPSESTQPPSQLITKNASELVLTINDFEAGWTQESSEAITKEGAQSAYHVYFYKGTSYPTVVQNTVAVYPGIDLAQKIYLDGKPINVSLEYPEIGDECFLNIAVPQSKLLVCRKSNVVVWVWLQLDEFGDVEPYAEAIEQRISGTEPSSKVGETGGCFIATAAYGTDTAQEIDILRDFRDEILLPNSLGAQFVSFYYKNSPPIAGFISQHDVLRSIVREGFVDPIVAILDLSKNLWAE